MEMTCYDEARDYAELARWWTGHGEPPEPAAWLPRIGFVARNGTGEGLAACFLYVTGTPVTYLHHLVGNPGADRREVARAVDAVVGECLDAARRAGGAVVLALTVRPHVIHRAKRLGFHAMAGTMLAREV